MNARKAIKKNKKTIWTILSIVIVIALGLVGCQTVRQRIRAANAPADGDIAEAFIGDLAALVSASGKLLPDQEATLALGIAGEVTDVYVTVGDIVQAGDPLVQLDTADLQRAVESAAQTLAIREATLAELQKDPDQDDMATARAAVASAQAQLDDLLAGPSEQELAQAEASLASAETNLAELQAGPSKEQIAQAELAVASARAALEAAKARYAALDDQVIVAQNSIDNAQLAKDRARDAYNLLVWNDWRAGESWAPYSPQGNAVKNADINYQAAVANLALTRLNINDAGVKQAEAQLAQAQAALTALTEEKTVQIAAAQAQVARAKANLAALTDPKTVQIAAARAQLAQAQANLAKLLDGASDEQIAIAQAQVEQARVSLEESQANLANATLTAPFDGTITDVYLSVGEWASGPAVELVNTNSLQVVLDMDEIDIGAVRVGQPAVIIMETWPNRELNGQVISIAPQSKNLGGIVTYEVHLSIDAGDLPIRTGMTANADLITAQRKNVLLVPNRAIIADRQENKYYVNLVQGDTINKVQVTIGLRDSGYTEIVDGIQEGDQVYIGEVSEGIDFTQGPPSAVREFRSQ